MNFSIGKYNSYEAFNLNILFWVGKIRLVYYKIPLGLFFALQTNRGIWLHLFKIGFCFSWDKIHRKEN